MSRKTNKELKEANGAIKQNTSPSTHTTHGGYTPIDEPIVTAQQLLRRGRGSSVGGSIGSFETRADYRAYLEKLNTAELHRHAIDEAHIVAIDDRERLIKRLENEWSGIRAKESITGNTAKVPVQRPGFTPQQMAEQEKLRQQLLKGRA